MKSPTYRGMYPTGDASAGIRFEIAHGKGTRYDTVRVPATDLLRFADAFRGCLVLDQHTGEGATRGGHACWHVDNPDMPIPCSDEATRAVSPEPDLAQVVRNYLGAIDRLADYDARAASDKGPYIGHEQDKAIHERYRDQALAAMRKVVGP